MSPPNRASLPSRLERDFYQTPTERLARDLLGKVLCVAEPGANAKRARILETEAYLGGLDPASHAYRGPTPRTEILFGEAGYAYVYFVYGMHFCFNVVSGPVGRGEAVLIRAVEPAEAKDMTKSFSRETMNGPGKLCKRLGIDLRYNKLCLWTGKGAKPSASPVIWLERAAAGDVEKFSIKAAQRVGLNAKLGECVGWPLRFCAIKN